MEFAPTFFVIGAQKAGTTTLHDWLLTSSQVVLPKIKETHFFSEEKRHRLGFEWYKSQFLFKNKQSDCVFGEVDPDYLFFPEAAIRIRELVQAPKLIIVFREPLQRAYSHYLMSCRWGHEKLSFEQALSVEEERCARGDRFHLDHHSYLARGLYVKQVLRIKKIFPLSKFLFLKFEDLFDQPQTEFSRICSFIGIDFDVKKINFNKKSNRAALPRSIFLRDFIHSPSKLKKCLGRFIFSGDLKLRLASWLDRVNTIPDNNEKNGAWESRVPAFLRELILKECCELEGLTELNFDSWERYHKEALENKLDGKNSSNIP